MHWLKPLRVKAIVIVVGNVITGGAGKTPTVIEIVKHLQSRGISVGVVSRGYGRKRSSCEEVSKQSSPSDVGDEPKLIHHATNAPVFVANSRYEGASELLSKYPAMNVIVCDDGLQHYKLYRDIEVCVFDDRGVGNGWLLPSGPLREPWPRAPLRAVGQSDDHILVLHTGGSPKFDGFRAQRKLSRNCLMADGRSVAMEEWIASIQKPILAIAGIAQPALFFDMARAIGLEIAQTMAMPDHSDFQDIDAQTLGSFQVICTEKDAFKLWKFVPDAVAIPLEQHSETDFFKNLDLRINRLLATKLSSPHGYQIT